MRKVIAFLIALTLLILSGWFLDFWVSQSTQTEAWAQKGMSRGSNELYYHFPDILITIKSQNRSPVFLSLGYTVSVKDQKSLDDLHRNTPAIMDKNILFLRDQTIDQVIGAQGLYRIREELLVQLYNFVDQPENMDLLIRKFLIQ